MQPPYFIPVPSHIAVHPMSSVLTQNVLLSSSPEYEEANQSYFTAFNNDISPLAIACPTSAEDVSVLLKELAKSETKIAVRGGGHTPWKGAANIHNGITIDMRGLKGVRLSIDETIVSVGAGERWENVYEVLEKRGLAVGGGRVSRVGVTGLTLGGEHSTFEKYRYWLSDIRRWPILLFWLPGFRL
jgi:FAD/FMN-containing dehydrogenase